jgi:hypothetical protein
MATDDDVCIYYIFINLFSFQHTHDVRENVIFFSKIQKFAAHIRERKCDVQFDTSKQ